MKLTSMKKNLTPSDLAPSTRREFIKKTSTLAAAVVVGNIFKTPVYGQTQAPAPGSVVGANERLRVAVVGVGYGIGKDHLQGIHQHATENNVVIAAASDVFNKRRDWAKQTAELKDADMFLDYKKLLERKD